MANDDSDAEFERRYPQKRQGMPTWAILLIVLGAVGALGMFALVAAGVAGFLFGVSAAVPAGPPPVPVAVEDEAKVEKVFTRAAFEKLLLGKTAAEVKAAIGEPPVSGGGDGEETWVYRKRTTNPVTGQTDATAEVVFRGGKAVRVDYRDLAPPGPGPQPGKE